jgi:hypothetical protein
MPLFEVAILEHPTDKAVEESNAGESLVFGPVAIIAKNQQDAATRAAMDYADDLREVDRNSMQVLVRPFA